MKNLILAFVFFPLLAVSQKYDVPGAINQFGFDFCKGGFFTGESLAFSPFSISTSLAMTSAGAQQKTLEEMKKVLHLSGSYNSDFKKFLAVVNQVTGTKLMVANRLWGQTGKEFKPEFIRAIEDFYWGDIVAIDFKNQPESAREKINLLIKKQTDGKIPEMLKRKSLTKKTELVLTSTIYLKANWPKKFDKSKTTRQNFQLSSTQKQKIPFMNMNDEFKYSENAQWQFISIPYQGDELSLDIFLPRKSISMSVLEKNGFDARFFKKLAKNARAYKVVLSLPKFKIESSFDLGDRLSEMGMPLAFDEYFANFRGIKDLGPTEKFYISKFIHKASITVDEEGSEVAFSNTGVVEDDTDTTPNLKASLPKIFNADRPFLFFVKHSYSGANLFMGRFSKP